jgi:hypothetical protein
MDGKSGLQGAGVSLSRGLTNEPEAWRIVFWLGLNFFSSPFVSTDVHSLQRYSYSDDLGLFGGIR